MMKRRTYTELSRLGTFKERFDYLKLNGSVGIDTFGFDRYLNQAFYKSPEWKNVRNIVILRDNGCDLGIEGYEIHMGETINNSKDVYPFTSDDTGFYKDNVYGSYVHGLFDNSEIAKKIVETIAKKNGKNIDVNKMADYKSYKESQYDILEKTVRDYVDIKNIYSILGM